MDYVNVGPVDRSTTASAVTTRAEIRSGEEALKLEFETPSDLVLSRHNIGDAVVLPALLIAMRRGLPLRMVDSVSPSLLANLETFGRIFATWFPRELSYVAIEAPAGRDRRPSRAARNVVGQCFTGGIDSMYSLLTATKAPDILIYGLGIDTTDPRRLPATDPTARLEAIAKRHDAQLVMLHTNVKQLSIKAGLTWGGMAHGAALGAIGHLLSGTLSTLVIPATHSYATAQPWGSGPWTDPLMSSRSLEVVHHGAELNRAGKTETIAQSVDVRDSLRVCLKMNSDENCGTCKKCIRTMLGLELAGGLSQSNRLPRTIDVEAADAITLTAHQDIRHIEDVRDRAVELGTRPDIVAIAQAMVTRGYAAIAAEAEAAATEAEAAAEASA